MEKEEGINFEKWFSENSDGSHPIVINIIRPFAPAVKTMVYTHETIESYVKGLIVAGYVAESSSLFVKSLDQNELGDLEPIGPRISLTHRFSDYPAFFSPYRAAMIITGMGGGAARLKHWLEESDYSTLKAKGELFDLKEGKDARPVDVISFEKIDILDDHEHVLYRDMNGSLRIFTRNSLKAWANSMKHDTRDIMGTEMSSKNHESVQHQLIVKEDVVDAKKSTPLEEIKKKVVKETLLRAEETCRKSIATERTNFVFDAMHHKKWALAIQYIEKGVNCGVSDVFTVDLIIGRTTLSFSILGAAIALRKKEVVEACLRQSFRPRPVSVALAALTGDLKILSMIMKTREVVKPHETLWRGISLLHYEQVLCRPCLVRVLLSCIKEDQPFNNMLAHEKAFECMLKNDELFQSYFESFKMIIKKFKNITKNVRFGNYTSHSFVLARPEIASFCASHGCEPTLSFPFEHEKRMREPEIETCVSKKQCVQ